VLVDHGSVGHAREATVTAVPLYALGDAVPDVHPDAWVHPDATLIGSVRVGAGSTIWPQAVLRGDYGWIRIGERTSVQDGTVIHCTAELPTVIGDDCVIGHLAHLECCTVEDRALIGTNSVVLHRAMVRTNALVGASALVPNDMEVPSGAMALGVPARLRLDAVTPDMIVPNAANYVRNGRRYAATLRRVDPDAARG
jgi:carbonic anhydrase/acetyltransferase-like protein (isoleucine patch superfamily)